MTKKEKKVYMRAYYAANTEKLKAMGKAYRKANPEKYKAIGKAWREANPEKLKASHKASNKAYREANPEKIKAMDKAYCNNLSRGYIASLLKIPVADLPPEMEEQKRMQMRITRTINQLNKTI